MGKYTNSINGDLIKQHPDYKRLMMQTYLTTPEWRNVEMAEELGEFVQKGNAFYRYPYFKQLTTFWRVFAESYRVAKLHHTHRELLTSEYMVMNLFIGVFTTVGFVGLGTLSSFLFLMKKQNHSHLQTHVGKLVSEYAEFIHKIPFYNFSYMSKVKPLWRAFYDTRHKSLTDYITFTTTFCQLIARAVVSKPIAWWYNQPQNQAADKIHLLVKGNVTSKQLQEIDKDIKLAKSFKKDTKNKTQPQYAHITLPRYEAFAKVINQFVAQNISVKKIASQECIQFKVQENGSTSFPLGKYRTLYSYQNHIDKKKTHMLDVPVRQLNKTVKSLKEDGLTIKFMHDF
jgi:hypothetical protein